MPTTKDTAKLPGRFIDLVTSMPPQAILDDVQLDNATEMIDRLMAAGKLTKGQELYLQTLVQLVEVYETQQHAIDTSGTTGLDSLKHVMESSGLGAADIASLLGVHVTLVYKILNGERSLTVDHMRKLAAHFKVRPDLFM